MTRLTHSPPCSALLRSRGARCLTLLCAAMLACAGCSDDGAEAHDATLGDAAAHDATLGDAAAQDASNTDAIAASPDAAAADAAAPDAILPDTTHDTNPVPAVPVLPHKTDFLNVGCRTHTYGGLNAAQRTTCRTAVKQRGYTHFYLYVYNEQDYGGPAFDYYADVAGFQSLLQELIADGLAPVVWLFPDDAPTIHGTSIASLKAKMTALVPGIDHLVSSYCLGLELDEYWGQTKVNDLGLHLRAMTSKQIAVHQLDGNWGYAKLPWVDYMILQYGFGESTSFIKNMTVQCMTDLGKPVVAGEYALDDEATGITLGNAAVAAGASGFGNGGTP